MVNYRQIRVIDYDNENAFENERFSRLIDLCPAIAVYNDDPKFMDWLEANEKLEMIRRLFFANRLDAVTKILEDFLCFLKENEDPEDMRYRYEQAQKYADLQRGKWKKKTLDFTKFILVFIVVLAIIVIAAAIIGFVFKSSEPVLILVTMVIVAIVASEVKK